MSIQEFYHENRAPGVIPQDILGNYLPDLPECPATNFQVIETAGEWTTVRKCGHFCGYWLTYSRDYNIGPPRHKVTSVKIDAACHRVPQRLEARLAGKLIPSAQIDQVQDCLTKLRQVYENCPQKPKPFI